MATPFPIRHRIGSTPVMDADVIRHVVSIYNIHRQGRLAGTRQALVDRGRAGTYWHVNDNDTRNHLTVWYVRDQGSQRTHIYSTTECNFNPGPELTAQKEELDAESGSDFGDSE